jgi:hypothetical protein
MDESTEVKETPKVLKSTTGDVYTVKKKGKKVVRAGSYNPKKRKKYEKMLEEAGS